MAEAAARRLTPVTLELRGKNPADVHASADLKVKARRMAWAKWMNSGQVCVSPDYVLVDGPVRERLVNELRQAIQTSYGSSPIESPDYSRIVSTHHFDRLAGLAAGAGGHAAIVGETDRERRAMGPGVRVDPDPASALMTQEVFGPILPFVTVAGPAEAAMQIAGRPASLVVHAFASDRALIAEMERETRSGAYLVNDAVISHAVRGLPFGSVAESGMGAYHGRHGFETSPNRERCFNARPGSTTLCGIRRTRRRRSAGCVGSLASIIRPGLDWHRRDDLRRSAPAASNNKAAFHGRGSRLLG